MPTLIGTAKFCSVFAVFGFVFIFIFGYMFKNQPLYLKGPTDKMLASESLYKAAGLYFVTWISSVAFWLNHEYKNRGNADETTNIEMANTRMAYGSVPSSH
jgi:hypothetical protein